MITYFTSESVFRGHPDKVCDQIADAILDEALWQDKDSKMAVECTIKDDLVIIYGEATTKAKLDYKDIALTVLSEIGYDEDYTVLIKVGEQSPEINHAVAPNEEDLRAGDQGIVFGYACNETKDYMPLSISLAHHLAYYIGEDLRDLVSQLNPDGKTQVTVKYLGDKIVGIETVLVSFCHTPIAQDKFEKLKANVKDVAELCLQKDPDVKQGWLDNTKYIINPAGMWTVGGSFGDSGTTGRKIVVDTYGGHGRIGGGALSSKDSSKVDRSGAYYARYVAKHIVASGLADSCEIQVSYGIGLAKPLSINVKTTGAKVDDRTIVWLINKHFNFSVGNIIRELDLKRPIYRSTACYGHFGGEEYPWEELTKLCDLQKSIELLESSNFDL